jgi:hypothetical protein
LVLCLTTPEGFFSWAALDMAVVAAMKLSRESSALFPFNHE